MFANVDVTPALLLRASGVLVAFLIGRFFVKLHFHRRRIRALAKEYDLPLLPHSYLAGHIPIVARLMMKYPADLAKQSMPLLLANEYPEFVKAGLAYVDVWPISPPMLAVFKPDLMAQFCQEPSREKHSLLHSEFQPFTNCDDLVTQGGAEWKLWRSIFNPGFSTKNVLSFVPTMIDEILVFKKWLYDAAGSGEIVKLEDQLTRLTIDIIGRVVLDQKLHCQTNPEEPVMRALKGNIGWLIYDRSPGNILKLLNPLRLLSMGYNNRVLRNAFMPSITKAISQRGEKDNSKTVCSLAINSYVKEAPSVSSTAELNPRFVDILVSHIKIFMFAGHDTTASTAAYCYHRLSENPSVLAAMRAEHDEFLGPDPAQAVARIIENPSLLSQLVYTHAVIKEVLRLYPPVGSIREGGPDFFLTDPNTGALYPTNGFMMFSCSVASQRDEEYFPQPNEFLPQRWFAKEGEPMYVRKNSFRPFELGPRNCVGQELAIAELKLILALTARELDVSSVYSKDGPNLWGDYGYAADTPGEVTPHPKLAMPVKVSLRKV